MKKKIAITSACILAACLTFSACGANKTKQVTIPEDGSENTTEDDLRQNGADEIEAPSKEQILAMRETVLEGMTEEETMRLTENIKVANLRLESAYLNDNIFEKLSDKDSTYWNYFDQKGDIEIEQNGETVTVYNRFDATNFINLMKDMQNSVQNEMLHADLQRLIDLTLLAQETHEMEYANDIYKILHDMDYFLLRYGIEDVGTFTRDKGVVKKYYGALMVYGATPPESISENRYHVLYSKITEGDPAKYGKIEQEHHDFQDENGSVYYYYDMECFYFNDSYPEVLNETLQTYYDSTREGYRQDSASYEGDSYDESNTPYDSLIFQYISYVGEDYVSLVYNSVTYMGGAHPYSAWDGITIDCRTGEIVSVDRFIDDSEEEVGEQLKSVLGMDVYDSAEWDYYITENSVVFFYYDPRYWDSVATKREEIR